MKSISLKYPISRIPKKKKQTPYRTELWSADNLKTISEMTEKLGTEKKKSIIDLLETQFVDDDGGFQRTLEHPKTSALVVTMQ
eukprot:7987710-Ditylum_brightwellii.AAC.1